MHAATTMLLTVGMLAAPRSAAADTELEICRDIVALTQEVVTYSATKASRALVEHYTCDLTEAQRSSSVGVKLGAMVDSVAVELGFSSSTDETFRSEVCERRLAQSSSSENVSFTMSRMAPGAVDLLFQCVGAQDGARVRPHLTDDDETVILDLLYRKGRLSNESSADIALDVRGAKCTPHPAKLDDDRHFRVLCTRDITKALVVVLNSSLPAQVGWSVSLPPVPPPKPRRLEQQLTVIGADKYAILLDRGTSIRVSGYVSVRADRELSYTDYGRTGGFTLEIAASDGTVVWTGSFHDRTKVSSVNIEIGTFEIPPQQRRLSLRFTNVFMEENGRPIIDGELSLTINDPTSTQE